LFIHFIYFRSANLHDNFIIRVLTSKKSFFTNSICFIEDKLGLEGK